MVKAVCMSVVVMVGVGVGVAEEAAPQRLGSMPGARGCRQANQKPPNSCEANRKRTGETPRGRRDSMG